jgi:hypothetical protein
MLRIPNVTLSRRVGLSQSIDADNADVLSRSLQMDDDGPSRSVLWHSDFFPPAPQGKPVQMSPVRAAVPVTLGWCPRLPEVVW